MVASMLLQLGEILREALQIIKIVKKHITAVFFRLPKTVSTVEISFSIKRFHLVSLPLSPDLVKVSMPSWGKCKFPRITVCAFYAVCKCLSILLLMQFWTYFCVLSSLCVCLYICSVWACAHASRGTILNFRALANNDVLSCFFPSLVVKVFLLVTTETT